MSSNCGRSTTTPGPLRVVVARKPGSVDVPGLQRFHLARGDEPLPGQLSDRLEQPVAGAIAGPFDLDQRLVGYPAQAIQHVLLPRLSPSETRSAAVSEKLPAKTARRRSSTCSSGSSRA